MILTYSLFSLNLDQYVLLFSTSTLITILCIHETRLETRSKTNRKVVGNAFDFAGI